MFDARKLLAAFEKPTYVTEAGQTIVGRPLSHPQFQQFLKDLERAGADDAAVDAVVQQALLDMQLPAEEILALPDPLYAAAITDFFRCCRGLPPPSPATPPPAPASTAAPTS